MKLNRYRCDVCGSEFDGSRRDEDPMSVVVLRVPGTSHAEHSAEHTCSSCRATLSQFIRDILLALSEGKTPVVTYASPEARPRSVG